MLRHEKTSNEQLFFRSHCNFVGFYKNGAEVLVRRDIIFKAFYFYFFLQFDPKRYPVNIIPVSYFICDQLKKWFIDRCFTNLFGSNDMCIGCFFQHVMNDLVASAGSEKYDP